MDDVRSGLVPRSPIGSVEERRRYYVPPPPTPPPGDAIDGCQGTADHIWYRPKMAPFSEVYDGELGESWGREGGGGREGGRGDFLFSFLFIFYRPYFIWFIGLLSAMFLGLQYTTSLSPRRPHCLFVCSNSHQMGVASKVGWHKTTVGWYYVSWSLIFSLDISLFDKRLLLHPVRIQSTVAEFFRTRQRVSPHGRWCWLALVALEFYCIGRFVAVWAVIMLNGDA